MDEPKQRIGRPAMIAAAVFLILIVAGILVQSRRSDPGSATADVPMAKVSPALPAELTSPPLGRAELIDLAAAAADAYATGRATLADGALAGRRLDLRLPFGCYGPAPESPSAPLSWDYDAATGVLRVSARPELWTGQERVRALAPSAEAIEGFWIERPWLREAVCPAAPPLSGQRLLLPAPRPTLGVAQVFPPGSSRVGRRDGKPYRAVVKLPAGRPLAPAGYVLVLKGRIGTFPGIGPIGCWSESLELRPVCLVAADIDRIALERPDGEPIGEWPN